MSPHPTILQAVLRALVVRLVLLLDGFLGVREAWLRARIAALPEGHKRLAVVLAELGRVERARAVLADPESYEDPRFRGLIATVARVRNDAGRRALVRRCIFVSLWFGLPGALPAPGAELEAPEGRCIGGIDGSDAPLGRFVRAARTCALMVRGGAHLAEWAAAP